MTRDRLKYAACGACGYQDGSREASVARLAMDAALDSWTLDGFGHIRAALGHSEKMIRVQRREEKHDLERRTKEKTIAAIQADPQAYGFGPIAMWFIWFLVGKIVERIVEWLIDKRYSGGDGEIVAAISARGP